MNNEDFDDSILNEFIAEGLEHLTTIENGLLALENIKDGLHEKLIAQIFRAIHSIKGAAGFLSLNKVGDLSHVMETLLDMIRERSIKPDPECINALLEGTDILKVMFDDLSTSNNIDIVNVHNQILEIIENKGINVDDNNEKDEINDQLDNFRSSPIPPAAVVPEIEEKPDSDEESYIDETRFHQLPEAIRINVNILEHLMTLAGELVLIKNQCSHAVENSLFNDMPNISQHLEITTTELQETIMLTRMQPIGSLFGKLNRIVRDLSQKLQKEIKLVTIGDSVEIDKTIIQGLTDPLMHLVRNSCDHAIDIPHERLVAGKPSEGTITVEAFHDDGQINIRISDDGKGLNTDHIRKKAIKNGLYKDYELDLMSDKEINNLIMLPGFSTAEKISDISGRGVGMDVVKSSIEQLGGSIEITTTFGKGTTISLCLPLTLAIIPSLIVGVDGHRFAIPQISLEELVSIDHDDSNVIECADNQEVYRLRDKLLPVVRLRDVLNNFKPFSYTKRAELIIKNQKLKGEKLQDSIIIVVVKNKGQVYGLIVDDVFSIEEKVVKPMHGKVKKYDIYSGATVLGDGKVALILDTGGIAKHAGVCQNASEIDIETHVDKSAETQSVLLFKSGELEQFALAMSKINRIELISIEDIEQIGEFKFVTIDNISTQIFELNNVFDVSPINTIGEALIILPKDVSRPCGILMSKVIDIVEAPKILDKDNYKPDGVMGTLIIKDKLTIFIDLLRFIKLTENEHIPKQKELLCSGATNE